MVKGISCQVIVVQSPEQKFFEQAIFILKDGVVREGVTDQQLLHEAKLAAGEGSVRKKKKPIRGPIWACGGALATGALWLLTVL